MTVGNVITKIPGKEYVNLFSVVFPANNFSTNVSNDTYSQSNKVVIPSIGIRDGTNLTSEYYYSETTSTASFGYFLTGLHYDVDVPIGQIWYFDIEYLTVGYYNAQRTIVKKSSGVATVSGGNNGTMNVQGGVRAYSGGSTVYNLIILTKVTFNHVG